MHLTISSSMMSDGAGVGDGTGAQVVFGGCQPVNDGGTPCDCRSVSTIALGKKPREI